MLVDLKCSMCENKIDTPVCVLCMTDTMETWFDSKKISLHKAFKDEVRNFMTKATKGRRITCDICRSQTNYNVCSACFTKHIFKWIANQDKKLAMEFVGRFSDSSTKKLVA